MWNKNDAALFGETAKSRHKKNRKLFCKKCDKTTKHELRKEDYHCTVCNSKKFIGFPEYVCYSHHQSECDYGGDTIICLDCPDFY